MISVAACVCSPEHCQHTVWAISYTQLTDCMTVCACVLFAGDYSSHSASFHFFGSTHHLLPLPGPTHHLLPLPGPAHPARTTLTTGVREMCPPYSVCTMSSASTTVTNMGSVWTENALASSRGWGPHVPIWTAVSATAPDMDSVLKVLDRVTPERGGLDCYCARAACGASSAEECPPAAAPEDVVCFFSL